MQKQLAQVKEFMTVFGQEVKGKVELPSREIMKLRVKLLAEEVKELEEACANDDLVEILDAFTDIRYVLEGAVLAFGMQGIAEEAFDAVHDSNMTKACNTMVLATQTKESYGKLGVETYIEQSATKGMQGGNLFLVKRKEDGKVLKSIHWKQQDLKSILDRHITGQEEQLKIEL